MFVATPPVTKSADLARLAPRDWLRLLEQHATVRGSANAVTRVLADGAHESVGYGELLDKVRAYAQLFEHSTAPSQIIPMVLSRGPEAVAMLLAALCAGRAFCTVNPKLRTPQIELILGQLGSPIAMIDGQGALALRGEHAPDSALYRTTWHVVPGAPATRAAQRVLADLTQRTALVPLPAEGRTTEDTAAREGARTTPSDPDNAHAVGCCLFTSGSTGVPKGVLISHRDLKARALTEVAWLELCERDVLLNLLPFSFDVGLNQVLSSALVGAELVVLDSWLPVDVLSAVASRGVTGIAAVPSIWSDFIAKERAFDRRGAHASLRFITVSGGDLSPTLHAALPKVTAGANIFKTYGQTEAFRIASLRPEEYHARPLSIGKALPGGHLYVVRDDGRLAAPGELGEVVHTGTGTMLGYLGESEQLGRTHDKLRPNPFRGDDDPNPLAVFTGDQGVLDEHGFLQLKGRRDDLVKIAGNRVYPTEVQTLISALPDIAAAEVVVLRGEPSRLAAFVVARAEVVLETAVLRRQLQERAPSYMVPEVLAVCDELPRTASGKPDRTLLTERALALVEPRAR